MAKSKGKSRSTQVRSKLAIQVGERIRKTRKQEGLSIENFALRCDIHPSYVGHIERGMQNPTLSTLERISQGLGISMDDLFKDIDTPINVENAAIRHLSQVISELSPEQTQQLLHIYYPLLALSDQLEEDCADIIAEGLLLPECLVRASMAFFQFPDTLSHISRSQLDMNYPSFKKMARQLGVQRQLLANRMKYLHILTSDVPYRHTLSLMEAG